MTSWLPGLGILYAGLVMGVICHELGHLICALYMGIPIDLVSIGTGQKLGGFRIGKVEFALHSVPLSGFVRTAPHKPVARIRTLVFLLGGIMANTGLYVLFDWVWRTQDLPPGIADNAGTFYVAQLLLIGGSLYPRIYRNGQQSDGYRILRLFRSSNAVEAWDQLYRAIVEQYWTDFEPPRLRTNQAAQMVYWFIRRRGPPQGKEREESLIGFLRLLDEGKLNRAEEMSILDALVCDGLASDIVVSDQRLDRWSRRLWELGPQNISAMGTRGSILVRLGEFAAAKSMLEQAQHPLDADKGKPGYLFHCFMTSLALAEAEHGLGDYDRAMGNLEAARDALRHIARPPGSALNLLAGVEARLVAAYDLPAAQEETQPVIGT